MTYGLRFMRVNQCLAMVLTAIGFLAFQQGCAVPHTYSYVGHTTFTTDNVNKLHTGMSPDEVLAVFGSPHKIYDGSFGQNAGEPWTGRIWLYFTQVDRKFMYVKRYKRNLLVFYPPGAQMRLNHWVIEE